MSIKKILLVSISVLLSSQLLAQGGIRIGLKGGINNTWLLNKNIIKDDGKLYELSFAGTGGLSVGRDATYYNYGLYVEFFFKQINQKISDDNPAPKWRNFTKLQYFAFPLLLRIRPSGDKFTRTFSYGGPYFEIGVEPALLLSGKLDSTYTDPVTNSKATRSNIDVSNRYESLNLAAVIGFGFHQIGTSQWSVTHGLRFSYGFLDIVSSAGGKGEKYTDTKNQKQPYASTKAITGGYLLNIIYKFQKGKK